MNVFIRYSRLQRHNVQQGLRRLEKNGRGDRQGIVPSVLFLTELLSRDSHKLFSRQEGLATCPLHTIGIGEESCLPIDEKHVGPLGDCLTDNVGEDVMLPMANQVEVKQRLHQNAASLIGVATGKETLKVQLRVPGDHLCDSSDGSLGQPTAGLKRPRFGHDAELKGNVLIIPLQTSQEGFIDV